MSHRPINRVFLPRLGVRAARFHPQWSGGCGEDLLTKQHLACRFTAHFHALANQRGYVTRPLFACAITWSTFGLLNGLIQLSIINNAIKAPSGLLPTVRLSEQSY